MRSSIILFTVTISLLIDLTASSTEGDTALLRLGFNNIVTNEVAYDAIIVPGSPCEAEKWSVTVKMRLMWAKYLYDNGFAKNIIVSGSSVYTKYNEAKVMAIYAEEMGIPKENIFVETEAEHSTENVYYSMNLAQSLGFKKLAVATDPIQMTFLLRKFMKDEKLGIDKIPVDISKIRNMDHTQPVVDLRSAINIGFVSVKERETRRERMRGTRGKHIILNN
jgi:uncharacterized SAM-binding protein YcdF (DUF218 family)